MSLKFYYHLDQMQIWVFPDMIKKWLQSQLLFFIGNSDISNNTRLQ